MRLVPGSASQMASLVEKGSKTKTLYESVGFAKVIVAAAGRREGEGALETSISPIQTQNRGRRRGVKVTFSLSLLQLLEAPGKKF